MTRGSWCRLDGAVLGQRYCLELTRSRRTWGVVARLTAERLLLASVSLARKADDHEARIKALEAENARLREKIARLEAA